MTITFGGKTVEQHIWSQYEKEGDQLTMVDPLPVPTGTPVQIMTLLIDHQLWAEQMLEEMAALARKQYRLIQRLKDPDLQDSPDIGKARSRSKQMTAELHDLASRICMLEARCDRFWSALPVAVRGGYGMDFGVSPEAERLIGQAWRGMAAQFKWPPNFTFQVGMVRDIPYALQHDLHQAGVDGWPLGKQTDPFKEQTK